ncbi:hypothetical protein AKJ54_00735 [candidate division MSBL1 archaeon SCGC-AAA382K21]|uniref:CARDB domain-containing protein n=1 Tax=candidate division MSBL1 archaeon SCGC-AAA382K21 TaxID=1698283 RepID=A0A133VL15_9EURY|nr:hypothetical protein AKJ54_00735 [candidate division MSBL1 archaeon SCGC-AAA382K21]
MFNGGDRQGRYLDPSRREKRKKGWSDKKKITVGAAILSIIIAIVGIFVLTRPEPNIRIKSMSLSDLEVAKGGTVTVGVKVTNKGGAEGTHEIPLKLNGSVVDRRTITLSSGKTKTVSFEVSKQELGSYNLNVEGFGGKFEVLEPAKFEVSNLLVTPKEVAPGGDVDMFVDVNNVGGVEGSHMVGLEINGGVESTENITVAGGKTETVNMVFAENAPGDYTVEVENLERSVHVLEPAEFEVSDLSVSPSRAGPGEDVNVSVEVGNVGEMSGRHTVELEIDGVVEDSRTVDLSGGDNTTFSFAIRKETKKAYTIKIGGLTQSFEVVTPATFEVSNLSINPTPVRPGETVNVSVDVGNVGELSGEYTVELKVDGSVEITRTTILGGGESTTLYFTLEKNIEKEYSVSVGNLSDSFEVTSAIITKYFEWTDHLNEELSWRLSIEKWRYENYRNLTHVVYGEEGILEFVTYKDSLIEYMANELSEKYSTPEDESNYILSFVQSFSYLPENGEYIRYPVETVVDNGDCEDTAILYAALMKAAGLDVALIEFQGHMMAGVNLPDLPQSGTQDYIHWFEKNGKRYYTCETTGLYWRVGDIPEEYQGESAQVYAVD